MSIFNRNLINNRPIIKEAWLIPTMQEADMAVNIVNDIKLGANAVKTLEAKQMTGAKVNRAFRPYLQLVIE